MCVCVCARACVYIAVMESRTAGLVWRLQWRWCSGDVAVVQRTAAAAAATMAVVVAVVVVAVVFCAQH